MHSMSASPHIFIATPCFGGSVTQSYMQSIIGCMAEAASQNIRLTLSTLGSDALITRARNTLLHQFMTMTDASHLLFVDSDIGFSFSDIQALLNADKPVIGGAYPLKSHYWDKNTERFLASGEPPETASLRYVGDCAALYSESTRPHVAQVSYVGTGFLLLTRATIQRMVNAYPDSRYQRIDAQQSGDIPAISAEQTDAFALFDCMIDPETRTYLSEDYAFCRRWINIGGTVWLHRGLALSHTGPATFCGNPANRILPLVK
ncbi:hypothetical protein Gbth_005_022 [Gluconobacter thailandicus F149-1 = NBRC 100600]|uniref:Glycosyltransferase n=1 Tax=Gluconobacter thailandicus NBRC 3257 TaxID=1381097 RepID=A0ABQ0IT44_GLUTH|nr:hypothetical protein [Gluconobacter thailandicus]KXV52396.1 hypothetical protein AD946_13710 [Gluconobacter thailandicus]GAC87686.1 hypothetical protein NBRC3255_1347 [Gluconobacter thailandicus NBRC 3255]GAD25351.1 hypothetical protein NBRC3257_0350 [Gluconobacter thailandicus NBRC 3257]GAN92021.1 hypothetical protein Gbth_005_022 [Gluconobacter thailandicus F149-1 = NBRC 100600]GBR60497.1 hypothetical protein AA100600_2042 [Gluconobacter thailandicus F149-1 = NBRC 100600]